MSDRSDTEVQLHPIMQPDEGYGPFVHIEFNGQTARAYPPNGPTDYNRYHSQAGYDPFADSSPDRAALLRAPPTAEDWEEFRRDAAEERYEALRDQAEQEVLDEMGDDAGDDFDGLDSDTNQGIYDAAYADTDHIDYEYARDVFAALPRWYLNRDPDFTAIYGALQKNPHVTETQLAMNDWLEEHGLDSFKFYFDTSGDEDHPRRL